MPHSPSPSDTSQGSGIAGISKLPDPGDDSSNEALVVDCDSPTGRSTTPGKFVLRLLILFYIYNQIKMYVPTY